MHRQLDASGLNAGLYDKVLAALSTRYDQRVKTVKLYVPDLMDSWGQVRISEGGDTIRTHSQEQSSMDRREASYVRVYCIQFTF
jgi:hypothetical protein